ncbi:histidine phosphatase family protein [Butyrivibrio sp. NC2007]|uniref:histidine phosphatase family protein n=1 Tax=Butyrivibrio sp. NC2007 TaxID=1280683 RepID=UPI00040D62EC|nr:histidine phosphatase family protein [Butyrivibrio sp. NC2007]
MEIILIRHGESIGNALKGDDAVYTGRWDCDLTATGYRQAQALNGSPIFENVNKYYCSPLKRAVKTARAFTDAELVIDDRIMERSLGDFEGKKIIDIKSDPQYAKYFNDPFYMRFRKDFEAKAPNGENFHDVCMRVKPFVMEILQEGLDKVVIVSHFVVIKCIIKELLELSEDETLSLKVHNCDPIVIEV